ncbi:sigma-54-dependent transcriptional regulator [Desulfurivibrio alkaliphilus]|uniref:Two component, sigma54 specific, transcriptional regulator, Fis family n=1 Tax=Desulfurivibrio alkaliphilus (strain DSM 19089 / UNIQEM U267 / AHT2) TaxID=589865 RepID=D6Z4S7_DESAT|nr:sigma-54 dependent transcriptional regulator [Desulfurivibrio alkaliphilus]ADH86552.1 two component, sigma54 specific, transcriptional regulator, Fis family [Desulfurivibrio alkaliphilus AHT 2]
MTEKILIIEDDRGLRTLLGEELTDAGFRVREAGAVPEGWKLVQQWQPDLILSDLRLPGPDGLTLLERLAALPPPRPALIIITAFGTVPQAVEALKKGADDFLTKPLDLDHLLLCLTKTLETRRLRLEVERFRKLLERDQDDFHGIIGRSGAMRRLFAAIGQVAAADGPVLITGESGVGKELVARAVHAESPRAEEKLIAVNCAGIPAELAESEFFGHAAGAFSGARHARQGLFMEARGGTLLLDEIGELPLNLQAKLLRILQDGMLRPVGSDREQQVEVRIIAASNRDLEKEVREGRFREDLYYRLETFRLPVPPLRQREDDLDLLCARFIELFATKMERPARSISPDALARLRRYPFPGNVRELKNTLERAVAFCPGREIGLAHLPERIRRGAANGRRPDNGDEGDGAGAAGHDHGTASGLPRQLLPEQADDPGELPSLEEISNRYVQLVMQQVNGNKRRAAQILGIGRRTLYRRLDTQP